MSVYACGVMSHLHWELAAVCVVEHTALQWQGILLGAPMAWGRHSRVGTLKLMAASGWLVHSDKINEHTHGAQAGDS